MTAGQQLPPAPAMTPAEFALQALESAAQLVEFLTGVKSQFITAGWSGAGAEQAALEVWRAGMKAAGK